MRHQWQSLCGGSGAGAVGVKGGGGREGGSYLPGGSLHLWREGEGEGGWGREAVRGGQGGPGSEWEVTGVQAGRREREQVPGRTSGASLASWGWGAHWGE